MGNSILLLPVAPLSKTKSRLRDCFSKEQLKELTIALFKDLASILMNVNCFNEKIVYCSDEEILSLASEYNLIGIKETFAKQKKSFDDVISELNNIAIEKFKAEETILIFLDLILISPENFFEIHSLLKKNQLVICPAIHSAGISILGRNPPNSIPNFFSDPSTPSFIKTIEMAKKNGLKFAIYDSFRAGFDIDIKHDLLLAYEYLKIFNLEHKETFIFLKNNLNITLRKLNLKNNREFKIVKRNNES
jgi:2-phospho-L-lactate guanylyltransferase (CobY/MobA/RfbA family)